MVSDDNQNFWGSSNPSHYMELKLVNWEGREGKFSRKLNFADQIQVEVKQSTQQMENSQY